MKIDRAEKVSHVFADVPIGGCFELKANGSVYIRVDRGRNVFGEHLTLSAVNLVTGYHYNVLAEEEVIYYPNASVIMGEPG